MAWVFPSRGWSTASGAVYTRILRIVVVLDIVWNMFLYIELSNVRYYRIELTVSFIPLRSLIILLPISSGFVEYHIEWIRRPNGTSKIASTTRSGETDGTSYRTKLRFLFSIPNSIIVTLNQRSPSSQELAQLTAVLRIHVSEGTTSCRFFGPSCANHLSSRGSPPKIHYQGLSGSSSSGSSVRDSVLLRRPRIVPVGERSRDPAVLAHRCSAPSS